jgi:putative flippase GtrA
MMRAFPTTPAHASEKKDKVKLAALYTLLAIVATIANIGSQDLAIRLYTGPAALPLSVFFGTAVGLVVKYVLDKRYIFAFRADNLAHDSRTFVLYTAMGLLTTTIFWGFEFAFHALFGSKEMRYLGGVIGLAIGYYAKYQLDRRFVFKTV